MKRFFSLTLSLSVLAACPGTPVVTPPTDMSGLPGADMTIATLCPRMGIVPADLRDVERSGEGLVSTTFGASPGRMPAWDRAATVDTILKQVWGRTKAACPELATSTATAAAARLLDDSIAALEVAIPAKEQQKAVYAANNVGLACPELFAYFHPDAPKEVIRMDAVYRQLGIDAHFGDLKATQADYDSLNTDWNNAKGPVGARAPMCHRVGGTATVSGDITASLANVATALPRMDVKTIETESDNGALEIDTLELLFDCPADNVTPKSGVGAMCNAAIKCDAGFVCDTAWGNNGDGKCAPDPSNKIGTPCTSTIDCGTDSRSACNNQAGDSYPGGYCFMEPCNDVAICPPGATCVALGGEASGCFKTCKVDSDCRTAENYVCQLFITKAPTGFGPSDHACAFPCTRDTDCQAPLKCPNPSNGTPKPNDPTYGKCSP